MSEEQSDKLKLNLKTTDTNRFKIEADQPTELPAEQLPKTEAKPAQIDELEAQRKVNTGSFKRVDVTGQAPANAAIAGMGDGGLKKSETVRLKVVRATPTAAPAAGPAASTVKLNLKRTDDAAPAAPAPNTPTTTPAAAPAPSPAHTSTLKLRPTTPAPAEASSAANTATVKVPTTPAAATVAVEPPTENKPAQATVAVEPPATAPAEGAKPALKLNKPKKEAAATVAVEPPPEAKPAEEKKEEPPKPAMKMKGASKEDDVQKYLPQQDDDEPGALEGVAALIAFLGTGFATYQLVMNFLQQIQ
jgi:hypothetical protein